MSNGAGIAYFSMEIALEEGIPSYSGGLGMLAGDTIRSAADMQVAMVAVTLLHRDGYFHQRLDAQGRQSEEPVVWRVEKYLRELEPRVNVIIEGRNVAVRAWLYEVRGVGGYVVPVYCLDTDLPENAEQDRTITHSLYGGDSRYRLCQEAILGMGGVRMLRALGHNTLRRFHMNEGHASLLTLDLLGEQARAIGWDAMGEPQIQAVREQCVFTTHTPVPAGHDQFPLELVHKVLGNHPEFKRMEDVFCCEGVLNMTFLALNLSHYVNGVAKRHGEVSRQMFTRYPIDSITNGVHAATWASAPFLDLYDRHIPGWREDNASLRYALSIPKAELWQAHSDAKADLIRHVNHEANAGMDPGCLTLGFARRATAYKRADLLLADVPRLERIAEQTGELQIIYGGKAHPKDAAGKEVIRRIFELRKVFSPRIRLAYLENYDMALGKLMTSGVDLWLNTPQPPLEASGTSGMKAAMNGVPSLSILDGWWVEGCIEGATGWAIGADRREMTARDDRKEDALALYEKLEGVILPMYYNNRERWIDVMRHAIALNGSFFNTERMLDQYVRKAYFG